MRLFVLMLVGLAAVFGICGCRRSSGTTARGATSPSTRPQSDFRVEQDVNFLEPGRAEKADLYVPLDARPARIGKLRAIVVIHGGAWSRGDKADRLTRSVATDLARSGFLAMSINYTLSTPARPGVWPQNLQDCRMAVRWLRRNADRLGIDAEHIGAIGASAGGHLCAMLAVCGEKDDWDNRGQDARATPQRDVSSRIQAAVDLYGPVEIGDFPMMGAKRADAPELFRQASPLAHLDRSDPPILIVHGSADQTVGADHSKIFAEALKKAGVEHELVIVEGAPHGFDLHPPQKDLRPIVAEFLRLRLGSE